MWLIASSWVWESVAGDTGTTVALEASTDCERNGNVRELEEASRSELDAIDDALIVVSIRYGDDGDEKKRKQ